MLAYTDLSVGQIAQTIGYSTSSRFAELFRKSTGLLPMEYRKMAQKNKKFALICTISYFQNREEKNHKENRDTWLSSSCCVPV